MRNLFTHVQSCGHTYYGRGDASAGREESLSLKMLALSFYPKSLSPGGAPSESLLVQMVYDLAMKHNIVIID